MGTERAERRTYELRAGRFRGLEWPGFPGVSRPPGAGSARSDGPGSSGGAPTAVLLHGLSGMADVWHATVMALPDHLDGSRPRCVAIDQRGHGRSPHLPGRYSAADYLQDLVDLVDLLGAPVRLVGHSMGARVAMIGAARHPELFSSVVVVDIGPEAWQRNISATTALLAARPERFSDLEEALSVARFIVGERGYDPVGGDDAARMFVEERLRREKDGAYTWLAPRDALIESVTVQRSRNYWRDWEGISIPTLLVRGGNSDELRPHVVQAMRRRNPAVDFVEIDGVGHNVPLLAPERLAEEVGRFWSVVER